MPTEIVDVTVPRDFSSLFCPVCGHPIWKPGDNQPKCGHLVFLFNDIVQEFDYASPACEKIAAEAQKAFNEDEVESPVQYVLDHLDPTGSILCFSTSSGTGPDSSTAWVAIDFDPPEDTASELANKIGKANVVKTAKKARKKR